MIGFVSDPHQTKIQMKTCTGSTLTKGSIRGIPRCCNPVDVDQEVDDDDDDDEEEDADDEEDDVDEEVDDIDEEEDDDKEDDLAK